MVVDPTDILDMLEGPARRHHVDRTDRTPAPPEQPKIDLDALNDPQRMIVESLDSPGSFDEIVRRTGLDAGVVRSETTILELQRIVVRRGERFEASNRF